MGIAVQAGVGLDVYNLFSLDIKAGDCYEFVSILRHTVMNRPIRNV